jgi:hypothetical protein
MPVAESDFASGNSDADANSVADANCHSNSDDSTNSNAHTHTDPNSHPDAERAAGGAGDQPLDADERSDWC